MATLMERLKVAWWFIERPRLYPEFMRYTGRRLRTLGVDRGQEAKDAVDACERGAVDPLIAIETITGTRVRPFAELFATELAAADDRLRQAPVKLHGAGNLDLIYHLTEHLGATRALETGVSAGWSSLAFLLSLVHRPGSKLASTDMPYPGSTKEAARHVGCVVPLELRTMWELVVDPDSLALPRALAEVPELDVAHYDSDKSYEGRMWAYRLLWRALRPGGMLISDDIDDNMGFFHFCGEVGQQPVVVRVPATKGSKYIGVVTKPAASTAS
ncbi:MAG: class I SAM-dependent methyltransferase [Deltaproteobacteria bacterium]|nr:class I SAM-dependent methyltransferase [Deltaproteobacteria bacterium]